ncbi:MAG: hypothetical protein JWQ71_4422 [Pedosphaera sp.]|nr:hypothetical protein [Pedosphaera sp.]
MIIPFHMPRLRVVKAWLFILFFFSAVGLPAWGQGQNGTNAFMIQDSGKWVKPVSEPADEPASSPSSNEGERYLLLDTQVHAGKDENYCHIVKKITSQNGVQNGASLSFNYDPTYQQLILHYIVIRRGDKTYDRLDADKIKVIQQEAELERHMYNGNLSAVLFLEDVRVGDIIEYAWTVRGNNPVLRGHFLNYTLIDWAIPIEKHAFRLLWPAARRLTIQNHATQVQPTIKDVSGLMEYSWELKNRRPVALEGSMPPGYTQLGWIQFTEFSSWTEVAGWAEALYEHSGPLPADLIQKIALWRLSADQEEQVRFALRFVQDEVRYLGIEIGQGSHQPNEPAAVFNRRFGDCKDKVALFCAILHELEIEAHPVLVDTYSRHVDEWAPSPYAFNHVTAQVKVNGKTYWLDPTRSYQRGHLKDFYFPDYGRGLIVEAGTTNLCIIPRHTAGLPKTTVNETFRIKSYRTPIVYEVTSIFEGAAADRMRATLAGTRREDLEKAYLNQTAKKYPKVKSAQPMEVQDDQEKNLIKTYEHYEVSDIYELSEDKKEWACWFYPDEIFSFAKSPETSIRTTPLGVVHPRHYIQNTEITLPQDYAIKNEIKSVRDEAMRFERRVNYNNRRLTIHYEVATLADEVAVKDVPEHLNNLKKIREAVGFGIQHANISSGTSRRMTKDKSFQPNWSILAMGAIYFLLVAAGAVALYWFRPEYKSSTPPLIAHPLKGIGGWLIVLAIAMCLAPINITFLIAKNSSAYSVTTWNYLTAPDSSAYHSLWAPILILELLGNLSLLVFSVLNAVFFFQKRYAFRRFFLIFLTVNVMVTIVDQVGCGFIPHAAVAGTSNYSAIFRTIVPATIWSLYILKSQRVKLTFVN